MLKNLLYLLSQTIIAIIFVTILFIISGVFAENGWGLLSILSIPLYVVFGIIFIVSWLTMANEFN